MCRFLPLHSMDITALSASTHRAMSPTQNVHSSRNAEAALQNAIMEGCDRMYDTVEVFWGGEFSSRGNGISYLIRFMGINGDPGKFEIVPADNSDPINAPNLTFYSKTTVPYSSNLFYEAIPFEMLRTYETEP